MPQTHGEFEDMLLWLNPQLLQTYKRAREIVSPITMARLGYNPLQINHVREGTNIFTGVGEYRTKGLRPQYTGYVEFNSDGFEAELASLKDGINYIAISRKSGEPVDLVNQEIIFKGLRRGTMSPEEKAGFDNAFSELVTGIIQDITNNPVFQGTPDLFQMLLIDEMHNPRALDKYINDWFGYLMGDRSMHLARRSLTAEVKSLFGKSCWYDYRWLDDGQNDVEVQVRLPQISRPHRSYWRLLEPQKDTYGTFVPIGRIPDVKLRLSGGHPAVQKNIKQRLVLSPG